MSDNTSLVNIGEISKPATVLIEKISDAVGGICKPWQIRRVAKAEADAERIRVISQIEINELQRRALERFVAEETIKQINIEEITAKALPLLEENAQPQNIENDWIANFFEKCRLISDQDLQFLWAKILAGEANSPGKYTKRTLSFLELLDKADAIVFQDLCCFGWFDGKKIYPLIYDLHVNIYEKFGITFERLKHLDEIGLVSFDNISGYGLINLPKNFYFHYYGKPVEIIFEKENENKFDIGHVILSKVGQELASICEPSPVPEIFAYILGRWDSEKNSVTSPYTIINISEETEEIAPGESETSSKN